MAERRDSSRSGEAGPDDADHGSARSAVRGAGGKASRDASWLTSLLEWWHPPHLVRAQGEEPDYRFSMANERTFLAWIRTSLALLAGGVAVISLIPSFAVPGGRHLLGIALIVLSIVLAASSYRHWALSERALRLGKPLPPSQLPRVLGAGVALVALAALIIIVVGLM